MSTGPRLKGMTTDIRLFNTNYIFEPQLLSGITTRAFAYFLPLWRCSRPACFPSLAFAPGGTVNGANPMTTAVLRSFNPDQGIVTVKVDGRSPDVALRVCGSDRSTILRLSPGHRISFEFACNRHGQVFAIDVTPVAPIPSVPHSRRTSPRENRKLLKPDCCSESEADLEELLAAPVIRRLMQRDGVDPQAVGR